VSMPGSDDVQDRGSRGCRKTGALPLPQILFHLPRR